MLKWLLVELGGYLLPIVAWNGALGVLNLLLAERSRIDAWAEAHPKRAAVLKALRGLGWDPWHFVAAATLWVKHRLPETTRPPAQSAQPIEHIYLSPPPAPEPRASDDDPLPW